MTRYKTWNGRQAGLATAMLSLALASAALPASAQTRATPQAEPPITLGEACDRRTDKVRGIVKRDACGRWYCGRTDVKDVIDVRPNIAAELKCTWRLVMTGADMSCRCQPVSPSGAQ